jgi:hypothetical protein
MDNCYFPRNGLPHNRSQLAALPSPARCNVKNPNKSLATSHPLPNVGHVVITGSPAMGWTLVEWDGIRDFSY